MRRADVLCEDRSVLVLNALLGAGTARAIFVAIFPGAGVWWLMPLMVAAALTVLLLLNTGFRGRQL
jgi:hypothetical protein